MRDECGDTNRAKIEVQSLEQAFQAASTATEEWIEGGDWGNEGAEVCAYFSLELPDNFDLNELADFLGEFTLANFLANCIDSDDRITVIIDPDEDALMPNTECPGHEWESTVEVDGGLTENPGVFSHGGTRMSFASHCIHCGLRRRHVSVGDQHNPGEHDTVEFIPA